MQSRHYVSAPMQKWTVGTDSLSIWASVRGYRRCNLLRDVWRIQPRVAMSKKLAGRAALQPGLKTPFLVAMANVRGRAVFHKSERRIAIGCVLGMALCILGAACDREFAWTSRLGIRMYSGEFDSYFTPEQLDAHAEAAMVDLNAYGMPANQLLQGASQQVIHVRTGPISDACPFPECNGLVLGNGLHIRALDCPWETALRHEMTHHLELYVTGLYDYRHERPYWKTADEPLGSCE